MAKLMDLEDILHEVKNKELIPSLREAVACYHASSFRACIMLSFNALVDDILIKLRYYKDVNDDAMKIYNDISFLIDNQTSFESQLIDRLVKAKIFTDLDGELYRTFQKFRHKSAHPSGYVPTAECARFIYTEIVRVFLSKESLQTTDRVEQLISDVAGGNFFISTNISERAGVVKNEISNIHPDTHPFLISKTYQKFASVPDDDNHLYVNFLSALFAIDSPKINELIIKIVIKRNISKSKHEYLFTTLMSANPSAFDYIDEVVASKLIKNLRERVSESPKNISALQLSNPFYCYLQISNKCGGELHKKILNELYVFIDNPNRLCFFIKKLDKADGYIGKDAYVKIMDLIFGEFEAGSQERVDAILNAFIEDDSQSLSGVHSSRLFELCCVILMNKAGSSVADLIKDDEFEQVKYIISKSKDFYTRGKFPKTSLFNKLNDDMREALNKIYL